MKKFLALCLLAAAGVAFSAERVVLFEEFTQIG